MTDALLPITRRYTGYAIVTDGQPEIHSLTYPELESEYADPRAAGHLAIALVDPHLSGRRAPRGERATEIRACRRASLT